MCDSFDYDRVPMDKVRMTLNIILFALLRKCRKASIKYAVHTYILAFIDLPYPIQQVHDQKENLNKFPLIKHPRLRITALQMPSHG